MKFSEKYPPLPVQFSTRPDEAVESRIDRTDRVYACGVCGQRTGFRFTYETIPGVPCCSEECKAEMLTYPMPSQFDGRGMEFEVTESPPSSSVDRSPDTGEATGSIPVAGTKKLFEVFKGYQGTVLITSDPPATKPDESEQRSDNNGSVGASTPAQAVQAMADGLGSGGTDDTDRGVPGSVLGSELPLASGESGAVG